MILMASIYVSMAIVTCFLYYKFDGSPFCEHPHHWPIQIGMVLLVAVCWPLSLFALICGGGDASR